VEDVLDEEPGLAVSREALGLVVGVGG